MRLTQEPEAKPDVRADIARLDLEESRIDVVMATLMDETERYLACVGEFKALGRGPTYRGFH